MPRPPRESDPKPVTADETASEPEGHKGTERPKLERPKLRRGRGNRKNTAADDAAEAARIQRRSEVFRLRADGITFGRIAEHLGISQTVAHVDYKAACRDYGQETASEHKARANARYDEQTSQLKELRIAARRLMQHQPSCTGTTRDDKPCPGCADTRQAVAAVGRLTAVHRALATVTHLQAEMNGAVVERVEHTGAQGGPIEVTLADVLDAVRAGAENAGRDARDGDESRELH